MSSNARGRRWTGWPKRKPSLLRPFPSLRVEELEVRDTPASFSWTGGGGAGTNWSNPANWQGNVAPTGVDTNQEALSFPAGVANRTATNDIVNGTFSSITIADSNYLLTGTSLTLVQTGAPGSGSLGVASQATNVVYDIPTKLGVVGTPSNEFFNVGNGGSLTVTGSLSGGATATLTKGGGGTLTLAADNSLFSGPILVDTASGTLVVTHPNALGNTTGDTTVLANSTLQVSNVVGQINEALRLNGPGVANKGALQNLAGQNTWAGPVVLDSNSTIGGPAGVLNITGQVSDTGSAHDLVKDGQGEIRLAHVGGNTYRGLTTINEGILTVTDALGLGTADGGTVVTSTLTKQGQLRLSSAAGFTVLDEALTLNGRGQLSPALANVGALSNFQGNNTWAGPVMIDNVTPNGTPVTIGAAAGTNLTVSGIVSSPNGAYAGGLYKDDLGRVIFNRPNTYLAATTVAAGTLNVRDSRALNTNPVSVSSGATLELQVEADSLATPQYDAHGNDLWDDSVTHDPDKLDFTNALTINGGGVGGGGALRSVSGINRWLTPIALTSVAHGVAAIGVDRDARPGHPLPDASYFTQDYSLTTTQNIGGRYDTDFLKVGTGHLILEVANNYLGVTRIQQGWVTIESAGSLGGRQAGVGDTVQWGTFVSAGAALHLKAPAAGPAFNMTENIVLAGVGPSLPYSFINQQGALLNIGGLNTWSGDIGLSGQAGIGAEQVDPLVPSELTVTGSLTEGYTLQAAGFAPSGSNTEFAKVIDVGSSPGATYINYNFGNTADTLRIYYPPRAQGGSRVYDSGPLRGAGRVSLDFGPGASTQYEIVVNEGTPQFLGAWSLTDVNSVGYLTGGGFIKLGSKRVNLQGDGAYSGNNEVREGTLRVQHDTALGQNSSGTRTTSQAYGQTTTTVRDGAVLELATGIPENNGGVAAGVQVWNEKLVLGAAGQQLTVAGDPNFGASFKLVYTSPTDASVSKTADLPVTASALDIQNALNALPKLASDVGSAVVTLVGNVFFVQFGTALSYDVALLTAETTNGAEVAVGGGSAALVNVSADNTWRGPISLAAGTRANVGPNTRLALLGAIDDAPNTAAGGSTFTKRGTGELLAAGLNTYRGITLIDEGVLTAANSAALGLGDGTAATGTIVSNNAQLQLQGDLSVAGEALSLVGSGPNAATVPTNVPVRWLNVGPAAINNGQTPGNQPVTGRVTGVTVDPTDSRVMYISTAGGGAWKTKDGGRTWLPLFDSRSPSALLDATLRGGAIAVDPSDPRVIVFGTGEANFSGDSYAGTGVYISTDSGDTWSLLTSATGTANPFLGQTISKIVIEPANTYQNNPRLIFVATSDLGVNGSFNSPIGVYRYNGTDWANLTSTTSPTRATVLGKKPYDVFPVGTPGPDDDYRISFPQNFSAWTDLAIVYVDNKLTNVGLNGPVPVLYASLGSPYASISNAVFRTENPNAAAPVWYVGDNGATTSAPAPIPDNRSQNEFPAGPWDNNGNPVGPTRNARIQFTVVATDPDGNTTTPLYPSLSTTTIYASIENPQTGGLLQILKSTDGGKNWAATAATPPDYLGAPNGGGQGWYDQTIVATDANTVYVAGVINYGIGKNHVLTTTDGGATWVDLTADAAGNGPHTDSHAMAVDSARRLVLGNDGGVWRYNPTSKVWNDLNGTLSITTFNGLDVHPTDFTIAYGASQDNGTEKFSGSQAWQHIDDGDGGVVQVDPVTPNTVYHVLNGTIRKSTDGGASWVNVYSAPGLYYPFVIDHINPSRLVEGDSTGVRETSNAGGSWTSLNYPGGTPSNVAVAQYQGYDATGNFLPDPGFPNVTDVGSNTYDPKTIYVTSGSTVYVTKDRGLTWLDRSPAGGVTIESITVDPSNRDTAYVVSSTGPGSGARRVQRTTDAGRTWTDVTGNLPDQPVWEVVVDPRDNTVYVGTDIGVYAAANKASGPWARFGAGMPNVQVKNLILNQTLNTLTAGTYGRSMFQLFLDFTQPDSGALRVVSGSSSWTGPITLTGDTTIRTDGTQNIRNGIAAAALDVLGPIGDGAGTFGITKVGGGTLTLSGSNTYDGQTLVTAGVLQSNNQSALGSDAGNTVVSAGAALELRSDLYLEPVTLNGNGVFFNGHFSGALRNVSSSNHYTGPLTFATNTTIGVDSGTQLTIGELTGHGIGSITDDVDTFGFDKELPGTLVLSSANTYDGLTTIRQGAIRVEDALALGTFDAGGETRVLDGAQLQISRNEITHVQTVVASEPLELSGTGIFGTGAILNVRGDSSPVPGNNNVWRGPITLTNRPNTNPATVPGFQVALGSSDIRDTLTLDTVLTAVPMVPAPAAPLGLLKVGAGRVTLTKANDYSGLTTVAAGTLSIQDAGALGTVGTDAEGTVVRAGTLELDGSLASLAVAEYLTLNGDGVNGVGALNNLIGNNSYAAPITLASDASIGAAAGTSLTIDGPLQDPPAVPVPAARFRKAGAGTVVLPNAETYRGETVIDDGILQILTPAALGTQQDESQVVRVLASSGSYALAFDGVTTAALPYTAAAATVEAALNALPTIGGVGGSVTVSGVAATGLTVTFGGTLQNKNVAPIVPVYIAPLVATVRNGTAGLPEIQTAEVIASAGNFALTFNGKTTGPLPYNATAAAVETALNALTSIGGAGGSVTVTSTGTAGDITYRITFGGTLGTGDRPQITSAVVAGTQVTVATAIDGQGGTTVNAGGTLQVVGNQSFDAPTGELVTLNGQGFNNRGALNVLNGTVNWNVPLVLGSDASIGTSNAADQLVFTGPISDGGNKFALDLYGPGTVTYQGTGTGAYHGLNFTTYTGTTTVHDGALLLSQAGGNAILGPLVVGDGLGGSALVRETFDNQVANASPVTVKSDGTFDLNGLADTIGKLTVVGGVVQTNALVGSGGKLTTADVDMTGGTIFVRDSGSLMSLNVTMSGGAAIVAGNTTTLTLGNVSLDASSITVGGPSTVTAGNVTMVNSSTITVAAGTGLVTTQNITMTGGAINLGDGRTLNAGTISDTGGTITLGNGDTVAATGAVSVTTGGQVQFGTGGKLTTGGNLTLDASKLSFAAGGQADTKSVGVLNGSTLSFAAGGKLTAAGTLTVTGKASPLTPSTVTFGTDGTATTGDVTVTDGSITFGDGGQLAAGKATILRGTVSVGNADAARGVAFTTTGPVSVTNGTVSVGNAGSGKSATFTSAGNLTLAASTLTLGTGSTAAVADITMTGASLLQVGADNVNFTAGKVTQTGGQMTFGNHDQFNASGPVSVSGGGAVAFGTDGRLSSGGLLALDDSTLTLLGDDPANPADPVNLVKPKVTAVGVALTTGAQITFADHGTLDDSAGNLTMSGASKLAFSDFGAATTKDIGLTGGSITFGNNFALAAGNVTDNGGTLTFGNTGSVTAGTVGVTTGTVTVGTGATVAASGALTLAGSTMTVGTGSSVAAAGVGLSLASKLTFADNDTLTCTGSPLTLTGGSKLSFGLNGTATTGDVTLTGGSIGFLDNGQFSAAKMTVTGAPVTLGNNSKLTATGTVSVANSGPTAGSISLGTGSDLTTGDLILNPGTVTLGAGGVMTTANVTLTGASAKITLGDKVGARGSLSTAGVTETGGSIVLGNGLAANNPFTFTATGPVSATNGAITFATFGALTTANNLTLNNSTLSFTTAGALDAQAVDLSNRARITAGAGATLKMQDATIDTSTVTVGDGSTTTARNVRVNGAVNGAALSFGNANSLTTNDLTATGAPISFGTGGKFSGAVVSVADATFGMGTNPLFIATGDLTLTRATLSLGSAGAVSSSTQNVTLTNGTVAVGAGTTVNLTGNVTADSAATGRSAISGAGTLALVSTSHTVAVGNGNGVADSDLTISTLMTATAPGLLVKTGVGRLELNTNGASAGGLSVTGGEVQVDAGTVVGPTTVATGGTLSGAGTVGTLGVADGTVSPGTTAAAGNVGVLHSGAATWTPQTVFAVNLSHPAAGTPVGGTDYDQLQVAGPIDLGGASLSATTGTGIAFGDQFTIITATAVTGTFQQTNGQDVLFLSGRKFGVLYNPAFNATPSVVVQKIRADVGVSVVASPVPSDTRQAVTFTATVVPEAGAVLLPNTQSVTFQVDGVDVFTSPVVLVGGALQATFTTTALTPGPHTLTAHFVGDVNDFNPADSAAVPLSVLVPAIDALVGDQAFISPNNSPTIQDALGLATAVRNELGNVTWTVTVKNSGASTVRTFSGSAGSVGMVDAISTAWDGKVDAALGGGFAPNGAYTVTVSFVDQYGNVGATAPIPVTVDNLSPTAASAAPTVAVIDPTASGAVPASTTLAGTVGDLNLDHWTVDITSGGTLLRRFTGTGTAVSAAWDGKGDVANPLSPTTVVADGAYTATVTAFDAAGNSTAAPAQTVVVLTHGPTVTLTTGPSSVYGQTFTLTAAVSLPAGAPAGLAAQFVGNPVQFFRGTTSLGTTTVHAAGTGYEATLTVPTLDAGTYSDFKAVYVGTSTFPPAASAPAAHTITPAPLTVTANDATKFYGYPVPAFTFAAGGLVNGDTAAGVFSGALATSATQASALGNYAITRGGLTTNGNYTVAGFTPGTLHVTSAPLTVVINDATKSVNTPNPAFTFSVQGLVLGDTPAVVTGLNPVSTGGTNSPVGRYPITAGGTPSGAPNYIITAVVPGTLTVTPIPTNVVIGTGPGAQGRVNVYNTQGQLQNSFAPFGNFTGGVRTVTADFNRDGTLDIAAGTGPGVAAQVAVFDGKTGAPLFTAFPFDTFDGGVYVAAGDIDGDGAAELVVTPDQGGGPRVVVYHGGDFAPMVSYFGINDPNFRGGARAGVGDMNADGFADIAVSAGFNGGPRVSLWDGKALSGLTFQNLTGDFFVFADVLRNGAFVSIGDVNGDGFGDLIAGAGPGGGPQVKVFDGRSLVRFGPAATQPFANFFAGDPNNRGGVRVAAKALDGDLYADVITGVGEGGGSGATAYAGSRLTVGNYDPLYALDAFPGFTNGVFVG